MELTLKKARQLAGLTQQEMADKLIISRHTYMKYEKNPDTVPVGTARHVSTITGISTEQIFFGRIST